MKSHRTSTLSKILFSLFCLFHFAVAHANTLYCDSPQHKQMDFWVGAWEARDANNKVLGYQLIEKIERNCVLQEWWRGLGEENGAGTSLSMYDAKRKLWNHTWMSVRGNLLTIEGHWNVDSMLMTGYYQNAQGQREFHRTQWRPLADGRVYHLWDSSINGGLTWTVIHEAWLTKTNQEIRK